METGFLSLSFLLFDVRRLALTLVTRPQKGGALVPTHVEGPPANAFGTGRACRCPVHAQHEQPILHHASHAPTYRANKSLMATEARRNGERRSRVRVIESSPTTSNSRPRSRLAMSVRPSAHASRVSLLGLTNEIPSHQARWADRTRESARAGRRR